MFYIRGIFGIAIFALLSAGESEIPVTICKRDSNDYNACSKHALEEAWPLFVKVGLPEFNFPSADPLFFKDTKVVLNSGEISIEVIFSNLSVIGISDTQFFDVRTHFLNKVFHYEMDVLVPSLFVEGIAKVNGSINIFRVADEGHLNATLNDIRTTCNLTGHVVNDTWIVEHFRINPSLGNLKIHVTTTIEENKQLNNIVLNFINEFWPSIFRVILPFLSDKLDPWATDYVNLFFSKVPFSKIFP